MNEHEYTIRQLHIQSTCLITGKAIRRAYHAIVRPVYQQCYWQLYIAIREELSEQTS